MDENPHVHCKHPSCNNEKEFEEDVQVLQDLCLVSISTDAAVLQMHSLVRTTIRTWLKALEEDKKWENLSFQVLAEEFPLHTEHEPLHICEQLVTHVDLDANPPPYGDAYKDWAQIIIAVGSHASDRNDDCLLRKTNEIALQFVNTHGHEAFHKEVSFPLTASLAFQLAELENCAAAEKLLNSLEDDRKSLPAYHPDLYVDLQARAVVYIALDRYNEAEALYRKALDTWRSIEGENGILTMDAKYNLGKLLVSRRRSEEAVSILNSLKGPQEQIFGEKHARTLYFNFWLACALHQIEEPEDAKRLYQRVLEVYEEGFGGFPSHEITSANQMAVIHVGQGRYDEAEILFRRALKRYEDTFGKGDSERAELYRRNLEAVLQVKAELEYTAELPCI